MGSCSCTSNNEWKEPLRQALDSLADSLDRQAFGGGPSFRYNLTEKITLSANTRLTRTAYDHNPKSANTYSFYGGWTQVLTEKWNFNINTGAEIRDEDNKTTRCSTDMDGAMVES